MISCNKGDWEMESGAWSALLTFYSAKKLGLCDYRKEYTFILFNMPPLHSAVSRN